jgi:hypothetical protein
MRRPLYRPDGASLPTSLIDSILALAPPLQLGLGTDISWCHLKDCAVGCEVSRSSRSTAQLPPQLDPSRGACVALIIELHVDRSHRSRKYYFVQISTGESTWDVPTMAAPNVPTPGGTPASGHSPYPAPQEGTRGMGGQESDRSLGVCGRKRQMRDDSMADRHRRARC